MIPAPQALRPIPAGRNYRVVLADPPWAFQLYSEKGEAKSPQAQYSCLNAAALKDFAREIGLDFCCAADCVLVMWATFPMLADGLRLIGEWGFTYKTGGSWIKQTRTGKLAFGPGYILRSAAEPWLLGTRGRPFVASHSERNALLTEEAKLDNWNGIVAEANGHSVKPPQLQALVERLYPGGPYLELFARRRRAGWDAYGDELGGFVGAGESEAAA